MSRRPARFTEADVRRAIRATAKEKDGVQRTVEIAPDGTIRIVPLVIPNEWDEVLKPKEGIVL